MFIICLKFKTFKKIVVQNTVSYLLMINSLQLFETLQHKISFAEQKCAKLSEHVYYDLWHLLNIN